MDLIKLLKGHIIHSEVDKMDFNQLTFNSKEVVSNTLFICKGKAFKKEYLLDAIKSGASAYVSEVDYEVSIPLVLVDDIRIVMPLLANAFYHRPYQGFNLVGITGTKGKSTVAYFYKKIIESIGQTCGILSSIDTYDGIINEESRLTTPESLDLFKHFKHAQLSGLDHFVMEVSSQGLKYNRVDEVIFDIGVFLNISPDHISDIEHPNYEDYFKSKLRLFKQSKKSIINLESENIDEILKVAINPITISTDSDKADYYAHDIVQIEGGYQFKVNQIPFELGLTGRFNVSNALAAIACAHQSGIQLETISNSLKQIRVPGRMETFQSMDKKLKVLVDYAHNTLSFENLFKSTINEYPNHKIVIIFGCPGHKSINRRKDLGEIANQYADEVYLCMEDPGYEKPSDISLEIKQFIPQSKVEIIDDRKETLQSAINNIDQPTIILFTGKGDETTQKIEDQYIKTESDIEITKQLIAEYNKNHSI